MSQSYSINGEVLTPEKMEESSPLLPSSSYSNSSSERDHGDEVWALSRSLSRNDAVGPKIQARATRRTLGLFAGVFCPVALSMFSTFLFLRSGFVVGQAGILEAVLQLVLAYFILVMTVLSISAISTNGALEGGGAYYMISRALGPEFGGSIGFLFFVANVLAVGLYVTGFVEAMIENFGPGGTMVDQPFLKGDHDFWYKYLYCTIVLFVCLGICIVGGAMFAKTSLLIFLIVVICLLSVIVSVFAKNSTTPIEYAQQAKHTHERKNVSQFCYEVNASGFVQDSANYTGLRAATFHDNAYSHYEKDYTSKDMMTFASVFAILFSSVTGILNGANMSGELKDPSKAIPKGTLYAVMFTFATYFIEIILVGGSCDRCLLLNNYIFLQEINLWKPFVLIGIFAATLSAALGNLIGASRILQALANDHLFWFVLNPASITTKSGNPYVAVLISWFLVQLVLLVGSLNAIAPATSVFFLMSYASVNLACLALELASAPNFRPTFKYFTWYTCVFGLIGCILMCFLISPIYTSAAIIVMLVLAIILHFRSLPTQWGSISQALIFHQVRKYLLMLDSRKAHVKYWRPQILLMVANPRQCSELIHFINDIKKGGLYVIGHVKLGSLDSYPKDPVLEENSKWMGLIDYLKVKAFVEVTMANSVSEGLQHLLRLSGMGGMKPNTVCFGFLDDAKPKDMLSVESAGRKRRFFTRLESGKKESIDNLFMNVRGEGDPRNLASLEYVKLISDSLKMQKNVCLCRHFDQLSKQSIVHSKKQLFIDVWPVNLFRPDTANFFDNTCLFMLQLACILTMVPGWKSKTSLRVFLCLNAQTDNTLQKQQKLDCFLQQLRIKASVKIVTWDHLVQHLPVMSGNSNGKLNLMEKFHPVPEEFISAINQMIISYSSTTAVSFLYLPIPPAESRDNETYLNSLKMLSENLPPTVFVHGLHPVTSTTL
ncbi:solute carrier family 12 member 9-like isoform X2 [Saccostrea echinata]|uniref:solute carrier family 12 member 9-like isoform X2 n=1 Tax=Saccostrea echinata TaxID=191078 RepID=UPI002A82E626|nr:solute carrier family 12 member 9-like isoform X2 [Saccostrea echinata]